MISFWRDQSAAVQRKNLAHLTEWEIWYISKNSNCRFSLNKVLDNLGQDQSGSLFALFRTAQFRELESLYGEQN